MKKPRSLPLATPIWLASALLVASLTGCASSGTQAASDKVDPLERYRKQAVEWKTCDPTILGNEEDWGDDPDEDEEIDISMDSAKRKYGNRLRCASIRAPLDWAKPDRGDVVISLLRLAARKPDQRRGSLLINPGGPGADGLPMAFNIEQLLIEKGDAEHPERALHLQLVNEYDMVGFSPRGTGASTQLRCASNELVHTLDYSAAGMTPQNIANARYNNRKETEACLKNPITPFINTDATARDMDLIRGLLGDGKLNYLGYSYGTWLGAWYASLFPDRVGRMVLDSYIDFSRPLDFVPPQIPARQRALDDILIPYAVRHARHFQLGTSEAAVRRSMADLSARMQHTVAVPLMLTGYRRDGADDFLEIIAIARELDGLFKSMPKPLNFAAAEKAAQRLPFITRIPARKADRQIIAQRLLASYFESLRNPKRESLDLDFNASTYAAIRCNDAPASVDENAWEKRIKESAEHSPHFFFGLYGNPCTTWTRPSVTQPDWSPLRTLDLLLVQSQYDVATPLEGANAFFDQLPRAYRVYVRGELEHGVFPYRDKNCVDQTVARYLLGESPAQRETVCPAHPLPLDARKPENRK